MFLESENIQKEKIIESLLVATYCRRELGDGKKGTRLYLGLT